LTLLLKHEHQNLTIYEAENIENLKTFMNNGLYNLVIIDWHFSRTEMDTLILELRSKNNDTIVVVLSQHLEDKAAAFAAGANAFVYKGDTPEQLQHTLLTYLNRASNEDDLASSVMPTCVRPIFCHYLI
jgi:DNA-binding response OmpR family regulator